ncbi:cdc17 [Nucleospora cyclopteri]
MTAITFLEFSKILESIEKTTKRLEIQELLSDFLKNVRENDKDALIPILFMSVATVYPQFKNLELNVGETAIQSILTECTGLSLPTIRRKFKETGDYGRISQQFRIKQLSLIKKKKLSCEEVYKALQKICLTTGKNSSNDKRNIMLSLIGNASPIETKYLIRLFEGKMKIGLALQTVLISLSLAYGETETQIIKTAFNKNPDFTNLIALIENYGIENLEKYSCISTGIPLKPMLATPAVNLSKAFSKFEDSPFLAEYKYDGERIQIHFNREKKDNGEKNIKRSFFTKSNSEETIGSISVYSRNCEEITIKFPDVASLQLSDKSYIIDGEVVAFENGEILPFQILSTRKRKIINKIEVKVCVFVFDILYFDGEELVDFPLKERRKILHANFREIPGKFHFAEGKICNSVEEIEGMFKKSIDGNCEGLMLKNLDALYQPSRRTNTWIKLKKDYVDSMGDSVDLIVIGAYYGKGKRTGTYGNFLLAAYNDEIDKFEACCKIGTGFSDENLTEFYKTLETTAAQQDVLTDLIPDVFIKPNRVWEVKAASLSLSPIYKAGADETGRGISLRFPRFVRQRNDKTVKEATTSVQLKQIYHTELQNRREDELSDEFN